MAESNVLRSRICISKISLKLNDITETLEHPGPMSYDSAKKVLKGFNQLQKLFKQAEKLGSVDLHMKNIFNRILSNLDYVNLVIDNYKSSVPEE